MRFTDIPVKYIKPWGANATLIRPIPNASQSAVLPGAASFSDGFPAITAQPTGSGGIPPDIHDFNGIFNIVTIWEQWYQAGGPIGYDSNFQGQIGGYPAGAVISSATTPGKQWLCLADNNATNPDVGGQNWRQVDGGFRNMLVFTTAGSFTVPIGVNTIRVRMWGGGGAGGAGNGGAADGGDGGGYAEGYIPVTANDTITFNVGQGGQPGVGTYAGDTTFTYNGILYAAYGGIKGTNGGSGIIPVNPSRNATCSTAVFPGGYTQHGGEGGKGDARGTAGCRAGEGGPSFGGRGGTSLPYDSTVTFSGNMGTIAGSGGGGATSAGPGGAGAGGVLIIEY